MTISQHLYIHQVDPFYALAVAEHRELHTAMESIRALLNTEGAPTERQFKEVIQQIVALRDRIARHFAQEERGGYLEEATTHLPRIAPQVSALQHQHEEILNEANHLLTTARTNAAPAEIWKSLQELYLPFSTRLQTHEAAENSLVQEAFNEDPGTEL